MTARYERHIAQQGGGGTPPPPTDGGIRDAHVIVVGQSGYLTVLANAGEPPLPPDLLNLDAATGDQESITCDYLDPGDGSQLALALQAAAASAGFGAPIDIRLRPCQLTLTAAVVGTTGLVVPAGCRLIGAGLGISTIIGATAAGATQCAVVLGDGASLEDITVLSPAPVGAPAGTQRGVVEGGAGAKVLRSRVGLGRSTTINRVQTCALAIPTASGTERLEELFLDVDSLFGQATPAESTAIEIGSTSATVLTNLDLIVRDVQINELTGAVGSAARAVIVQNVEGGVVVDVRHAQSRRPSSLGAYQWAWNVTSGGAVTAMIRAPQFKNCIIEALDDEGSSQMGFAVRISGTPNLSGGVWGGALTDCEVRFLRNAAPSAAISKIGFLVAVTTTDGVSNLNGLTETGCKAFQAVRGFSVDTSGGTGIIQGVSLVSCSAPAAQAGYLVQPNGCVLRTGAGGGAVRRTKVVACDFAGVNTALGIGLEIEDAAVADTIASLNTLTTGGAGTALVDAGTGSETPNNIVT